MNIPQKMVLLLCCFAYGTLLSGCMTGGAAFGLGVGAVHETETVEDDPNQSPPVYGPPQIIYRIDGDRYFTLENYVSCEKGETFYNNKKKDIHVKISPASGYLFKGRLYWVSSRDDYLAFPTTKNTEAAACMGSDKGCKNVITITTDGGKTLNATTYGIYSQDPTGITKDYDMLVTNSGFYIIDFSGESRSDDMASTWKWTFDPDEESTKKYGYPGVTGPDSQDGLPMNDISKVKQVRMQCDKSLIPQQKLN